MTQKRYEECLNGLELAKLPSVKDRIEELQKEIMLLAEKDGYSVVRVRNRYSVYLGSMSSSSFDSYSSYSGRYPHH